MRVTDGKNAGLDRHTHVRAERHDTSHSLSQVKNIYSTVASHAHPLSSALLARKWRTLRCGRVLLYLRLFVNSSIYLLLG